MSIYSTTKDNAFALNISTEELVDTFEVITDSENTESLSIEFSYSTDELTWSTYKSNIYEFIIDIQSLPVYSKLFIKIRCTILMSHSPMILPFFELTEIKINDLSITNIDSIEMIEASSSILTTTKTSNLLNPYRKSSQQDILVKKISKSISDIFGFESLYFRTEPGISNYTFQTYTLSNVIEQHQLQIVIKDNYIPDNKTRFAEFDIDFQDELEIHIVKEEFNNVFVDKKPNSNDFLFLPLTNQMYQINTVYDLKEFMNESTFYKLMLVKYENRADIKKTDEISSEITDLIEFDIDFHSDDVANDKANAVKEFNNVKQNGSENNISDESLVYENNTEIFRWSYNFEDVINTESVLSYDINNVEENQFSVISWIKLSDISRWIFKITNEFDQKVLDLDYNQITHNFTSSYYVENLADSLSTPISSSSLVDQWIGIIINYISINNTKMLTISIFDKDLTLIQEASDSSILQFTTMKNIDFYGGQHYANIRIGKSIIPKTSMEQTLQNMLPEVDDFYVIDNAVPQIK